jgi:hypothetical protein
MTMVKIREARSTTHSHGSRARGDRRVQILTHTAGETDGEGNEIERGETIGDAVDGLTLGHELIEGLSAAQEPVRDVEAEGDEGQDDHERHGSLRKRGTSLGRGERLARGRRAGLVFHEHSL